jgi:dihydroxyacetone kinase
VKKLMNEPSAFVDQMLEGLLLAHPDRIRSVGGTNRALVRGDAPVADRVGIVTGGGSGHLPVFLGYVGRGLASGVAIGNVFSSPTVEQIVAATRGVHSGKGVLYLYGNYSGDVLNFDTAAEIVDADGIHVETVLVADDVASAPPERSANRRGVAGLFYAYKIAGAKAEAGGTLDEVKAAALKAVAACRTMGVGLTPCVLPTVGKPTFSLADTANGLSEAKLIGLLRHVAGDMIAAEGELQALDAALGDGDLGVSARKATTLQAPTLEVS